LESKKNIDILEASIQNPSKGLPEDLFLFVSRITPLVNVDLLIKNEQNHTLWTWRDDAYYSPGWHLPGGIIRYKETIAERIRATAKTELGAEVEFQPTPLGINEIICPDRRNRGHFISLLYQCSLITSPDEWLQYKSGGPLPDQWMWFDACPENIIAVHEIYREYILKAGNR